MDDNDDAGQGTSGWTSNEAASVYQAASTSDVYVTSSTNFQTSQEQTFTTGQLTDSQFHALAPANYYQPSTSSYERVSPVEYPSSASANDALQQFRALSQEGAQLIRVAAADGRGALSQPFVTVLLAPSSSSGGEVVSGQAITSMTLPHIPQQHIEVASLAHLSAAESTTNEATPLGESHEDAVSSLSLALQHQVDTSVSQKVDSEMDSFANEPDTTQEDTPPSFSHAHHDYHRSLSADARYGASHLDLNIRDANGLDSTMNDGVTGGMDSTVMSTLQVHDATMDPSIGTSTMTSHTVGDGESELSHMLVTAGPSGLQLSHHAEQLHAEQLHAEHLHPDQLHHDQLHHEQLNHDQLNHDQLNHDQLSHDQLSHDQLNHDQLSHEQLNHAQLNHDSLAQEQLHVDQQQAAASGLHLGHPAQNGLVHSTDYTDYREVRKSERIAQLDRPLSPIARSRYIPTGYYNTEELWCDDCQISYVAGCPKHRMTEIYDRVVLSRAWASLPSHLQIFRLGDTTELGVFAKKAIPKRTQFGPFIGELVSSREQVTNQKLVLQVERAGSDTVFFEATDENRCNWMMFVRPADTWAEQNLIAYQYGIDIYFATIKHIEPRQELKVWYAPHYADRLGLPVLYPNEQDMEAMDQASLRWPCYECNRRFRSSAQLQKHLAVHDEPHRSNAAIATTTTPATMAAELMDQLDAGLDDASSDAGSLPSTKRKSGVSRGKARRGKTAKIMEMGENGQLNPNLKKKTSIYQNKYKRYHRDTIKRSIKSLYKRKGKESGGQEWVCMHCDLTFDNASLLNLHTLTHAAVDVGLSEIHRLTADGTPADLLATPNGIDMAAQLNVQIQEDGTIVSIDTDLECPLCRRKFDDKRMLIEHASEHAKTRARGRVNPAKPYKCSRCWKAFTANDRLQRHMLCHGEDESKPLACPVCAKRFMNNSALACHLKTHSDAKYFDCPMCHEGFDQVTALKEHVVKHAINGIYTCPECHRAFQEYNLIRKHMRAFHSDKQYQCTECEKIFARADKLKLHLLKHSTLREFMCDLCGRQFKRKDKLKEHIKRLHGPNSIKKPMKEDPPQPSATPDGNSKKFVPKVSPQDYHRFIYKCHTCLLGFKRRGMLVNHLAKRHPDIKPEQVPELNLPILKTQRDYFCQYCDKVYKSSSKRKSHILKNHPGAQLPICNPKERAMNPGLSQKTYSQPVGSVTTVPHPCHLCHKQYASKAKLLQHQRKKHAGLVPPVSPRRPTTAAALQQTVKQTTMLVSTPLEQFAEVQATVVTQQPDLGVGNSQGADLLTQAMSELQSFPEYRTVPATEFLNLAGASVRLASDSLTPVTISTIQPIQASSIELSQLTQLMQQHYPAVTSVQTISSAPQTVTAVNSSLVTTTSQVIPTLTPVTLSTATGPQRAWTTALTYPSLP